MEKEQYQYIILENEDRHHHINEVNKKLNRGWLIENTFVINNNFATSLYKERQLNETFND